MRIVLGIGALVGLLTAAPMQAQQAELTVQAPSSVLIIDSEDLFRRTAYGQRLIAELDQDAAVLQAENDRIVADLLAEESALTQQRPTMEAAAFRAAAAAFDAKAEAFRSERDAAAEALLQRRSDARTAFLERTYPIIGRLMLERRASVVLDRSRRSVFLAVGSVDITTDAVALIDQTLGDGSEPIDTQPPAEVVPDIAPDLGSQDQSE